LVRVMVVMTTVVQLHSTAGGYEMKTPIVRGWQSRC
jgi:hypothetical protein